MHIGSINRDNASVLKILRGATALFGRCGYHGTSLHDIAREAGVSKSLLHYHFESKEHLFMEAQLELLRELLGHVRTLTAALGGDASRSLRGVEAGLAEVMDYIERDVDQIAVMLEFRTVAAVNPAVGELVDRFHAEVLALAVDGIHNALGPLVDRLVLPPERLAQLLLTLFNGVLVDLAFARGDEARERVRGTFEDMRSLLVGAVLAPLT